MSSNRLRLNPSKTQYIWLGTPQQLAKLDLAAMAVRFPHNYSLLAYCSRLGTHTGSAAYLCSSHNRLCRDCYYPWVQIPGWLRGYSPSKNLSGGAKYCISPQKMMK